MDRAGSDGNTRGFQAIYDYGIENDVFRSLAENSSDFFGISDLDLKPIYVNPAGLKLVGVDSIETLKEISVLDCFFPEDQAFIQGEFFEKVNREGSAETEIRFRNFKNGKAVWMVYCVFLIKNNDGETVAYGTVSRSIDDRKSIEGFLFQAEKRYRLLFDSIDEGLCIAEVAFDETGKGVDYVILDANPAYERISGIKEPIGRSARELVPDIEPFWAETYGRIVKTRRSERFINYSEALGIWFDVYAFPFDVEERKQVGILFSDISDRKRIEVENERLAARNLEILESITDAFFAIDRRWLFTYGNPQTEDILGRKVEEFYGKNLWEEFPGLIGTEFETAYRDAMDKGVQTAFTAYYPDHDRWYDVRTFPSANGITIYFRDVSKRIKIEENLRSFQGETERQRRNYEAILSNTPDLGYVWDLDHRFIYVNEGLLNMWGKTWDESIGKNCLELGYEPWHAAMHDREIDEVVATKKPVRGVVPFNGTFGRRMYDYILVPVFGADGEVEAVAGTTRDVTDIQQNQRRNEFIIALDEAVRPLETPEEITQTLARLLGEYLGADRCAYAEVEADENHFYITGDYVRGDTESIVGRYAMSDFGAEVLRLMLENKPYIVNDVDDDTQVTPEDLAAYRLTAIQAVICIPLHKNGRFVACMAVHQKVPRNWSNEEIEIVTVVANRFWEAIERARVLKSLNESLTREQEARQTAETFNRIKDEFLATVSHELRTPLNAILGWSTMLRAGKISGEQANRAVETVERSARAQAQLIDDLLDISRIITGKLRLEVASLDLSDVITSAVDAMRPAADAKNIRLQMTLDSTAGLISGDANRLQQVVWNLVSNAVKFTPRDGRVQIRLERINSHVEIIVSDTGKGIEADFLPFIFDRFRQADQTTTRQYGGLGLGLSIVRQLVEMHGGTIHAESAGEDKGSTFVVKLPRLVALYTAKGDTGELIHISNTEKKKTDPENSQKLRGVNILVVDDEPDSRELLKVVLMQSGANVMTAASTAEAFQKLAVNRYDLLVSDIGMPNEDGYEFIEKLRRQPADKNGRIAAIALTAYARVEDRVRALNAGFQTHIAKPVEPAELTAVAVSLVKGFSKD